ncbi:hypothetical protein TUM4438_44340 [Shewanella sairae]|uniref:Uncharacterized protein n=1 Tax=Shewanella sairae TaxID=190310 RepID=A0ABQ4PRG7_9GAMM|nr:TrbI F-type domain-containing protein [Shewanella sairae]MCL1132512.1 type-F conjugative transfer system protein TrbI [Shewanella sairae]GIU52211.1 hypothetical protein TUM4438_44340 [Shewanella sairae]
MKKTLLTIALSVAFSIPATLIVQQFVAPNTHIVTVDTTKLLNDLTAELASQSLPEAAINIKIDEWAVTFDSAITRWASQNNSIIVDKSYILNQNTIDITRDIAAMIDIQAKHDPNQSEDRF